MPNGAIGLPLRPATATCHARREDKLALVLPWQMRQRVRMSGPLRLQRLRHGAMHCVQRQRQFVNVMVWVHVRLDGKAEKKELGS